MDQLCSWITKTVAFVCQLIGWITKIVSRRFFKENTSKPPNQLRKENTDMLPNWYWKKNSAMPPDWYLDHATECLKRVQQMMSSPNKLKVCRRQCEYLAEKLELAIKSSKKSLDRSLCPEHKVDCREALKFLFQLAKEVERIIMDCCGDVSWMQAAFTWTSVPVRVSTLGWYLKLCTKLLRSSNKLGAAWQTFTELEGLREVELHAIEERASTDEVALLSLLESLCWESTFKPAKVLLKRLKAIKGMSTSGSEQLSNLGFWTLDGGQLRQGDKIGHGYNSTVFKGRLFGALEVAEKEFDGPSNPGCACEVSILAKLSHPNIVSFLGYLENTNSSSTIMELMDGDLRTLMQRKIQEDVDHAPFNIQESCDIILQVAEGVHYMHQNGIVHGDLKSRIILVRSLKDDDIEYTCAKVSGFEISKRKNSITHSFQTRNVGTTRWMAPEVMDLLHTRTNIEHDTKTLVMYPFKIDVYSFGMLCFEILTGDVPFSDIESRNEVLQSILDGRRPKLPFQCPKNLKNLIELCWDTEPTTRPCFNAICEELRYIKCSLLLDPLDRQQTHQLAQPIPTLDLPRNVSKFKEEYSTLKVVRQLGKGGLDTVTVYLAIWHSLNGTKQVAQKRFIGSHSECFVNEVSILVDLEHPHIVSLLCYAIDRRSCSIVMELMDEDLHDMMVRKRLEGNTSSNGPFSNDEAIHIMLQIAVGMDYVHEKNIVHRDLKSCNILVKNSTKGGRCDIKVADFGLAKKMESNLSFLDKDAGVGTVRWMAPEVIKLIDDVLSASSSSYDPFKSDVYSFGMVCYEVLSGDVPFFSLSDKEVKKKVLDCVRPLLPKWTPFNLKTLVEKCWHQDPISRPIFARIIKELTQCQVLLD